MLVQRGTWSKTEYEQAARAAIEQLATYVDSNQRGA